MAFPLAKSRLSNRQLLLSFLRDKSPKFFESIDRVVCIDSKKEKKKENNALLRVLKHVSYNVLSISLSLSLSVMQWQKSRKGKAVTADSGLSNETR